MRAAFRLVLDILFPSRLRRERVGAAELYGHAEHWREFRRTATADYAARQTAATE